MPKSRKEMHKKVYPEKHFYASWKTLCTLRIGDCLLGAISDKFRVDTKVKKAPPPKKKLLSLPNKDIELAFWM